MRFDQMIRAGMTVRDVKVRFPQTVQIFDGYGFRESCDDCSIDAVARKLGVRAEEIVEALNEAAFSSQP